MLLFGCTGKAEREMQRQFELAILIIAPAKLAGYSNPGFRTIKKMATLHGRPALIQDLDPTRKMLVRGDRSGEANLLLGLR